jgi:hypothetical protein
MGCFQLVWHSDISSSNSKAGLFIPSAYKKNPSPYDSMFEMLSLHPSVQQIFPIFDVVVQITVAVAVLVLKQQQLKNNTYNIFIILPIFVRITIIAVIIAVSSPFTGFMMRVCHGSSSNSSPQILVKKSWTYKIWTSFVLK